MYVCMTEVEVVYCLHRHCKEKSCVICTYVHEYLFEALFYVIHIVIFKYVTFLIL
jgi:hypothetical protein